MGVITEKVRISFEVEDKQANRKLNRFQKGWNKLRFNIKGFNQVMGMSQDNFRKVGNHLGDMGSKGAKFAGRVRMMTHGLRGFRMEMLGVMFFGMGMTRLFKGMLKPALEATGIFQLMKETLLLLFLPIAVKLVPIFVKFLEKVANMSEATKLFIGKLVLVGIGLGVVLTAVGTLALGLGSLILVGSAFFNIIDKLIPNFNFLGLEVNGFVEAGLGIGIIGGLVSKLKGFLGELWTKAKESEFFGPMIERATELWKGLRDKMMLKLDELGITGEGGIISKFSELTKNMNNDMIPAMESMADSLKTIVEWVDKAIEKVKKLLSHLKSAKGASEETGSSGGGRSSSRMISVKNPLYANDFVMRPGQAPLMINPNDTLIGVKDSSKIGGGGATINQTLNITAMNERDIIRLISEENNKLLSRLTANLG